MPLHLGLILPNSGDGLEAERLAACALAAEESGFDSGWVTDHLVVPDEHAPVYGSIAEALVALGFLAGRTQRLGLGVSALIVRSTGGGPVHPAPHASSQSLLGLAQTS